MTQSVESRNIGGQVVYGVSAEDLAKAIAILVSSGALHTYGVERREGEDIDFDVVNTDSPCLVCTYATGDDLQVTGPCRVVGFSVKTAITTAPIEVRDGLNDTGTYKFSIPSGAAVGVHHFGGNGFNFVTGSFLDFGSAAGSVALLVRLGAGSTIEA